MNLIPVPAFEGPGLIHPFKSRPQSEDFCVSY